MNVPVPTRDDLLREVAALREQVRGLARDQFLLRTLLENVPDGIYFKDVDSRFVRINRAVAARFGLADPAEAAGRTDADFFSEAFAQETRRDELEVMRTGQPLFGKEEKETWPDGRETWAMTTTMPVRGPDGAIVGTFGISRDLTARKLAEDALRDSEARLRMALGAARMGTWDWDLRTGRVTRSSDYEALFGLAPGAFRGVLNEFLDRIHPEDQAGVQQALERSQTEHTPYWHEYRVIWPDGGVHWLAARGRCYRDVTGRPVRMIGVSMDVTDRKQLEEQLRQSQKMESVGRLAGGIAHDFNNLLTGIQGYSELLLGDLPDGDPNREMVHEIQRAADRAALLTGQLLAFGRRQRLALRRVDLNVLLVELAPALRHLLGPSAEVDLAPNPEPAWVQVDLGQMQQMLVNLTLNARDAMPGGGRLTLRAAAATVAAGSTAGGPAGEYVLLTVGDTGRGMTPEVRSHLFEPFFTTKGVGQGTGMSMSSTYGFVVQSGGFIEVDTEPGRGATFHIYLPRATPSVPGATKAIPGGKESVLLIGHAEVVRNLMAHALRQHGYRVSTADAPAEAFPLAAPVELIVAERSAWSDLCHAFGEAPLQGGQAPRVLILADDREATADAPAGWTILAGPFSPEALLRGVRDALDV